jgi:hypothetical protein
VVVSQTRARTKSRAPARRLFEKQNPFFETKINSVPPMDRRSERHPLSHPFQNAFLSRANRFRATSGVLSELYSRFDSRFETRVSRPGIVAPRT